MRSTFYKGPQVQLDLEKMIYKRDSDRNWMKLPDPKVVVLTQRGMRQSGGYPFPMTTHRYKAFCVYIRAGELNILAYQGRRHLVEKEAQRISAFLNVPIKDLFPRDAEGNVIDDDHGSIDFQSIMPYLVLLIALLMLSTLLCN